MNNTQTYIDLTHTLSSEIPTWDGDCHFNVSISTDYIDCTPPDLFRVQKIDCAAGIGTHIDAPAHVIEGGRTVDQLMVNELVVDCVVIDVQTESDESYVIQPEIIEIFEEKYGKIKPQSFVIFYTGWDRFWDNKDAYRNEYKFPSIDVATAEMLIKRDITGIGIDTLSADTGINGFPVHRAVLGADKYLVENIAHAKNLPPIGAKICIAPIKIKQGTEAPIRLIALL